MTTTPIPEPVLNRIFTQLEDLIASRTADRDDAIAALADLVRRVDNTPIADGSNIDTAWAHAVLAPLDGQS